MAEWSNAADSKSVVPATVPGVRIPISPLSPAEVPPAAGRRRVFLYQIFTVSFHSKKSFLRNIFNFKY